MNPRFQPKKECAAAFFIRSNRSGLTLVELLAVITILALLMVFAMPSLKGIGQSSGLATGGNTVVNLMNFARQNAVSRGLPTALVLLTGQGVDNDYRTLSLMEFTAPKTSGTLSGSWQPIGRWEVLPAGVIVDTDKLNSTFLTQTNSPYLQNPTTGQPPFTTIATGSAPFRYAGTTVKSSAYFCRVFLPNGGLSNPDQPAQLRLVSGYMSGTTTKTATYTHPDTSGKPSNFYDATIVGASGRVKITRP